MGESDDFKRLSGVVVVECEPREGRMLGPAGDRQVVMERVGDEVSRLAEGIWDMSPLKVYTSLVNLRGVQVGGDTYSKEGVRVDEPIEITGRGKEILDRYGNLVSSFRRDSDVRPVDMTIKIKPVSALCKPEEVLPCECEVELVCDAVVDVVGRIQERRKRREGMSGVRRVVDEFLEGRDRWPLRLASSALEQVRVLRDGDDRERLMLTLMEMNESEIK